MTSLGIRNCQFTLDGPRDIHDSKRILKNGNETFDLICENAKIASNYIGKIAMRINIDKGVSERFDDLFDQLDCLKNIKNIGIYPAHLQSEISQACACIEGECLNVEEFSNVCVMFHKAMIKHGFGFHWMITPRISCCGATTTSSMVIGPSGDLWKCWNQVGLSEERFSNISDMDKYFDDTNYYNWILHNPFKILQCKKCLYFPVCLGGCPAKTIKSKSSFLDTQKKKPVCNCKIQLERHAFAYV
jgi:uncharacterized protein